MVSVSQDFDISEVLNHFEQKKCINHQKRKSSLVCLHEDCWKSEYDEAFFCEDCYVDHSKKHGNFMRCNALFTGELFEELDECIKNEKTKNKLKERIRKFEQKIDELHLEIEKWTKCQFSQLKKVVESHLIENSQISYFEDINNIKKMLSEARIYLILNNKSKEKLRCYCSKISKIQNDLNEVTSEAEKRENVMDAVLNSKLQQIGNEIKEIVKNKIDQLEENLINCNKKSN